MKENEYWLIDYAMYMAVKDHFKGVNWLSWDEDIRNRDEKAMKKYREELKEEILFYEFQQYLFASQWLRLKKYANEKDVYKRQAESRIILSESRTVILWTILWHGKVWTRHVQRWLVTGFIPMWQQE